VNEDELRALVRMAIQKHLGSQSSASAREPLGELRRDASGPETVISFAQYRLDRAAGDTTCLIEPAVQCNHCGFCKCHGH
jgi:hypothetical protein